MRALSSKLSIFLIAMGLSCLPAHAQLRTIANERGNLVFVNDSATTPAKALKVSSTPAAPSTAAVKTGSAPAPATSPASTRLTTPQELDHIVQTTAEKHRVDPRLVRAVIATESNWNATAVSSRGARGLMQLIPGTAQLLGVNDAFDPAQNVDGGVRYLGMMLDRYNGDVDRALAAYNAGPGAVDRSGGIPRIAETRNYVMKVTSAYGGGTGLQPRTVVTPLKIYRAVDPDGRVVFRNE